VKFSKPNNHVPPSKKTTSKPASFDVESETIKNEQKDSTNHNENNDNMQ
jgi:hypothetical protein